MRAIAINRTQELIFLEDGTCVKMQNYVDRFGEDTDDAFEAVSAIAALPNGRWLVIDLDQFEIVARH